MDPVNVNGKSEAAKAEIFVERTSGRKEGFDGYFYDGRKEVLFDGYFYDVTDFVKKHPGGSIIEYYTKTGEDGTHAIQQFHQRSIKRVKGIMSSFKKRPALDSEIESDPAVLKKKSCSVRGLHKAVFRVGKGRIF